MGMMLAVIVALAVTTKKYTQSVADFLAANRCAGRYLLCVASGIAGMGAISIVAKFEMYWRAGFTAEGDVLPECMTQEGVGPDHSIKFDVGPEVIAASKVRFPIRDELFTAKATG